eukprot:gene14535-biopygen14992
MLFGQMTMTEGMAVGLQEGPAVGAAEAGEAVGATLGLSVVGGLVGAAVGASEVGEKVGDAVGASEGARVEGAEVGIVVGVAVVGLDVSGDCDDPQIRTTHNSALAQPMCYRWGYAHGSQPRISRLQPGNPCADAGPASLPLRRGQAGFSALASEATSGGTPSVATWAGISRGDARIMEAGARGR